MDIERDQSQRAGRCCWHCRHYIRPAVSILVDGPAGYVCTIDRDPMDYGPDTGLRAGERYMPPSGYCDRFEMDPPPPMPWADDMS